MINVLNNISTYLKEEDYRISILSYGIHVLNYGQIVDITDTQALLRIKNKIIKINGTSFRLTRLDKKELLINGNIKKVEINEF